MTLFAIGCSECCRAIIGGRCECPSGPTWPLAEMPCSRCHRPIKDFNPPNKGMTAGYYVAEAWQKYANPGEDYDYDLETLLTKSLTRPAPSEAEEIAAFEAARVAQRIPLERWRAINTVPARWYPETLDAEQEAMFEAEYAARAARAELIDAQAGEQLSDEIEERRAARAQKRSAA